ncbi:sigma-E factor negative regulatory protein [Alishewanella jeotgali]|uniref:Anti-sigma-E factor RseA n=1 Tax=Alishewanella jeotgali KCTC 22429 TaxID=1129374 RepID=H3ZH13_9ALTE|nr:RseA family anti-sigma factor [Alishewanella jeotgali]EHR40153.1 anti sigma-E protein RseA domain-containing protein [Alishewanella jeotgali KCTC 22429]
MLSEKQEWLSEAADNQPLTAAQLDALLQQREPQQTLERYQLMGAILRNEDASVLPADFSERFAARLEQEATYQLQPQHSLLSRLRGTLQQAANAQWFKPAAQGAIAAGVALVAVFGVQQYQQPLEQELMLPTPVLQTRPVAGFATPVSLSQTSVESRFAEQEQQAMLEQQRRLQALLQAHRQQVRLMEQPQAQQEPEQQEPR